MSCIDGQNAVDVYLKATKQVPFRFLLATNQSFNRIAPLLCSVKTKSIGSYQLTCLRHATGQMPYRVATSQCPMWNKLEVPPRLATYGIW